MDGVDASEERISSFHQELMANSLKDGVLDNLRLMFPHVGENTIRDIVIHQSFLLNGALDDQTRLTNNCIDVLLETRTIQRERSPILKDYIDLTQFEDSPADLGLNSASNNTLDDTPDGSVSFVDLIADKSSSNSKNDPPLKLVSSNSPLSNASVSGDYPITRGDLSNISLESIPCDLQQFPKVGSVVTPNAVSMPVRFHPDIPNSTPPGSRNVHPTVANTLHMRSPDNYMDGYVSNNGQHRRAKSSKAPSTLSRCPEPCDDCKTNPSSHSHHNSPSSHNGDRARHRSTTQASGSIGESEPLQSSATFHLGDFSSSGASNKTTTGNTVPTRVASGTSMTETPADSEKPPVQRSPTKGDLLAKLQSLDKALFNLTKMSKSPRKTPPRPGTAKQTSCPVTTTSVPVTSNTTGLSKPGFQKASSFASNPVNMQPETAKVNNNGMNSSIYNKPSTSDVNRTGTRNPGVASNISPTKPGNAGLVQERASCRHATSTAGPLPSTPSTLQLSYSKVQRVYKSPSSTSFPSASHLKSSSLQPHFVKDVQTQEIFRLPGQCNQMPSSTQHAVGTSASSQNPGAHSRPGQSTFTKQVSTNSQSLSKPTRVGQVARQRESPNQAAVGRLDSEPRTTASSVRPAVHTCQTAAAGTSVSHASASAVMDVTFINPFGNAKQLVPTVNLPPATSSSLGINSQQQHHARAHPSSLTPKEQIVNKQQLKLKSSHQKPASRCVPQHQGPLSQPKTEAPLMKPDIQKAMGHQLQPPVQAQQVMVQQLPNRTQPAMVDMPRLALAHLWQPPIPAQVQPVPTPTVPQPPAQARAPPAQAQPAMAHQPPAQAPTAPAQPAMAHQPPARAPPAPAQPFMLQQLPARAQAPPAPAQPFMLQQLPARAQAPPAPAQPFMLQQLPARAQAPPAPAQPAMLQQLPARAQAPPAPAQPGMVNQDLPMVGNPLILSAMLQQPPQEALLDNLPFTSFDQMAAKVLAMFQNVEPEYVMKKLKEFQHHPSPVQSMCDHLLENANYPKVKKPDVPKTTSPKDKGSTGRPDYVKDYFKITSTSRNIEVMWQLQIDFPRLSMDTLRQVFNLHFHHYAPTRICLEEILRTNEKVRHIVTRPKSVPYEQRKVNVEITTKDKQGRAVKTMIPIQVLKGRRSVGSLKMEDQELQNQMYSYKEYTKNSAVEKDLMLAKNMNEHEYEAEGQLIECGCCYNEVPFENMVQCLDGHLFCTDCLQNYTKQAAYGQGKAQLMCMQEGCNSSYPRVQLEKCLTSNVLKKYDERVQEECIQLADLEGYVKCPSCDFGALLDPGDKVFKCQRIDCMKESCRHCGEDWAEHFGKRCEEIEKKNETNLRVSYEERMSKAHIRTCHRCKTGIMKDQGCNKMTCRCGAKMCYICRMPNIEYTHFCQHVHNPGQGCTSCVKCSLWTDPVADDARAVKELEKELEVEREKINQAKESREPSRPIDLDGPEAKRQRVV